MRREVMRRRTVRRLAIEPVRIALGTLGLATLLFGGTCFLGLPGLAGIGLPGASSVALAGKLRQSDIGAPDFSAAGYKFSQFRFSPNGQTDVYGHGRPGAVIIVTMADRVVGQGGVDAEGRWHIAMAPAQPVGLKSQEVHLQLLAYDPLAGEADGAAANDIQMVDDVRFTVPIFAAPSPSQIGPSRAKSHLAARTTSRRGIALPPLPTRRALAATGAAPIKFRSAGTGKFRSAGTGKTNSASAKAAASAHTQLTVGAKVQPSNQDVAAQLAGRAANKDLGSGLKPAGSMLKRSSSMVVTASSTYGQAGSDLFGQGRIYSDDGIAPSLRDWFKRAQQGYRSVVEKLAKEKNQTRGAEVNGAQTSGAQARPPNGNEQAADHTQISSRRELPAGATPLQYLARQQPPATRQDSRETTIAAAGQPSAKSAEVGVEPSQAGKSGNQTSRTNQTDQIAPTLLAQASGEGPIDRVQKWYKKSDEDFRDVMRKLSVGDTGDKANRGQDDQRQTSNGLVKLLETVLPMDWWKRTRDDYRTTVEKLAKKKSGESGGGEPLGLKGAEPASKSAKKALANQAKERAVAERRAKLAAARAEQERQQRLQKERANRERRLAQETRLAKEDAARRDARARARAAAEQAALEKEAAAQKAAQLAQSEKQKLKQEQRRRRLAAEAAAAATAKALETAQAEAAAQKAQAQRKARQALERARMLAERQTRERRARAELKRRVEEQKRKFAVQQRLAAQIAAQNAAQNAAKKAAAAAKKTAAIRAAKVAKAKAAKERELALEQARIKSQRQARIKARIEAEKQALAAAKARELAARRRKAELASRQAEANAQAKAKAEAAAIAAAKSKRQSVVAAAAQAAKQAVDQKRKRASKAANGGDKPDADESLGNKVKRKFAFSIKEAKEAAAAALGAARAKIAKEEEQNSRKQRLALSLPTRRKVDQGSRARTDDGAGGSSSGGKRQAVQQGPRVAQKSTLPTTKTSGDEGANRENKDRPACKNAGLQIDLPGWYIVRRGDTLRTIARQHYRSSRARRLIFRANEDRIDDLDDLRPCTRVRLPLPEPAG